VLSGNFPYFRLN